MQIDTVYVRFFKSFNFNYQRMSDPGYAPDPWDKVGEAGDYPFVEVPLAGWLTTVVGANESGKSQLISAIKCALTGKGVVPEAFCRYSHFFGTGTTPPLPDFGLLFSALSEPNKAAIRSALGLADDAPLTTFRVFRFHGDAPTAFITIPGSGEIRRYDDVDLTHLKDHLPRVFEMKTDLPLPTSVPIKYLADPEANIETPSRWLRQFWGSLFENPSILSSTEEFTSAVPALVAAYNARSAPADEDKEPERRQLADALLTKVSGVHRATFDRLLNTSDPRLESYRSGLAEDINRHIRDALNFPKYWSQDSKFELLVELRDGDLAFMIQDRTGRRYSFSERSGGLVYFLSYFVQYLAHTFDPDRPEVLLMDEPDAYLSSQGQQDLLRIFREIAFPSKGRSACQVVYVTHSPFLIDKNHGDWIRVLQKGDGDQGTRIVRDASQNRYEPLRSAFGSFVGETTFIGNCNLLVEGISDQVLLATMSARIRSKSGGESASLDLNGVTLVPAGGTPHIPYTVYLARGRGEEKPAVIVLLDSDEAGNNAKNRLRKKNAWGKAVVKEEYVFQIGDMAPEDLKLLHNPQPIELEDLVPVEVGIAAVQAYASEFCGEDVAELLKALEPDLIQPVPEKGMHEWLERACIALVDEEFHLDKTGFARHVSGVVGAEHVSLEAIQALDHNFAVLFRALNARQHSAQREETFARNEDRLAQLRTAFLRNHKSEATREQAATLFNDIAATVDPAESLVLEIGRLTKDFNLEEDPASLIIGYEKFKLRLERLAYIERISAENVAGVLGLDGDLAAETPQTPGFPALPETTDSEHETNSAVAPADLPPESLSVVDESESRIPAEGIPQE